MTATQYIGYTKILEKKTKAGGCGKDIDFHEISSYLQGILSLVAKAVNQIRLHCSFFSTNMSCLLLRTGNVSDSGCWLLLGLVLLFSLFTNGRKEENVLSLNTSSFHTESERRGSMCRHIHMGFHKPAQMGRAQGCPVEPGLSGNL